LDLALRESSGSDASIRRQKMSMTAPAAFCCSAAEPAADLLQLHSACGFTMGTPDFLEFQFGGLRA